MSDLVLFPLSPFQLGLLAQHVAAPGVPLDVEQLTLALEEDLDVPRLAAALATLAAHHEGLRTRFVWEGVADPGYTVEPTATIPLASEDWSSLQAAEQEGRWRALLAADRQRGFDLRAAPLSRATAVRWGERRWRLLWTFHHLIADGPSYARLVTELMRLHDRRARPEELSPATPFAEYVRWLGSQPQRDPDLWRRELANLAAPTPLPAARETGSGEPFDSAAIVRQLTPELAQQLRALAAGQRVSLNAILLAAWALLLARYSQEPEVVFGGVMSARRLATQAATLLGAPLASVPLRIGVAEDDSVGVLIGKIWARWLAIAMNWPWRDGLAQIRRAATLPGDARLFDSIVVFDEVSIEGQVLSLDPSGARRSVRHRGNTGFGLTLYAHERPEFELRLEYDGRRYDATTTERLLEQLATILAGFAANADAKLGTIEWLSKEEKRRVLVEWNETSTPFDRAIGAHELIERQAAATPERWAVRGDGVSWTYAQLNARANKIAHRLRRGGVGRGSRVGVMLGRSPWMLAALLAAWKAGACYVPLDPDFPAERLAYMAEDAQLAALVTDTEHAPQWRERSRARIVELGASADAMAAEPEANPTAGAGGEDLAYLIYTSGSTGRPKGVLIPHRALVNFLQAMRTAPGIRADDVMLALQTISFDMAIPELWLPLTVGACVEIVPRHVAKDGALLQETIRRAGATIVQATPTTWQILFETGWRGQPGLRAWVGAEAVTPAVARGLLERVAEVWNLYGPTETTVWSTAQRLREGDDGVPIGRPLQNTRAYVFDRLLRPMPIRGIGELYLGGDGLAHGYLDRPELTATRFLPDPINRGAKLYRTGDLARWRDDGALECLGRADHQVKLRGYRIELGEIEATLTAHPAVSQAAVILREDRPGHKVLAAYVVAAGGSAPQAAELRTFLGRSLPDYMIPALWVPLAELPLSPNGKIDRKALPAVLPGGEAQVAEDRPATETERRLAEIWRVVLGIDEVGRNADFFAVGGDSLLAVRVLSRVGSAFGCRVSLGELFQEPTLAAQARAVEAAMARVAQTFTALAADGDGPIWFCVRATGDTSGAAAALPALAAALVPDQRLYALTWDAAAAGDPQTVAAQAAACLRQMTALQPVGPYYLAGFDQGGVLAWNIARQLTDRGATAGRLVLVGWAPPATAEAGARPRGLLRRLRRAGTPKQAASPAAETNSSRWAGRLQIVLGEAAGDDATPATWQKLADRVEVGRLPADGLGAGALIELLRSGGPAGGQPEAAMARGG